MCRRLPPSEGGRHPSSQKMRAYAFKCARATDMGVLVSLLESMRAGDGVLVAGGTLLLPVGCAWSKIDFPAEAARSKKGRPDSVPAGEPRKRAYALALSSDRSALRSAGFLPGSPQLDVAVLSGEGRECRIVLAASEKARAYYEFLRALLVRDTGHCRSVCGPIAWGGNGEGSIVLHTGVARALRGLLSEWGGEGLATSWGGPVVDTGGPISFRECPCEPAASAGVPQDRLFVFSEAMRRMGYLWVQWGPCGAAEMGVATVLAQSMGTYIMCGGGRPKQGRGTE